MMATLVLREIKQPVDCDACYKPFHAGDTVTLDPKGKPMCRECAVLLKLPCCSRPPRNHVELSLLPAVRVFSMAGPCLTMYRLVKANRTTYKLAYRNGDGVSLENVHKGSVHIAPCPSCTDHPRTQYPHGYMD